jgi:hypothetical protein
MDLKEAKAAILLEKERRRRREAWRATRFSKQVQHAAERTARAALVAIIKRVSQSPV